MHRFEHPWALYGALAVPLLFLLWGWYRLWRRKALAALGTPADLARMMPEQSRMAFWVCVGLIAPLPFLIWWFYRSWRQHELAAFGKFAHLARVMPEPGPWVFWLRGVFVALALGLLAMAVANPLQGAKQKTEQSERSDVVIALDISQSMLCNDVAPSRLERAKAFGGQLIKSLNGARIGLVFFAGNAFLEMPLTDDYEAALMFLQSADPGMVSEQGTAIRSAVETAQKAFESDPGGGRALLLITDGEDHDSDALEAVETAAETGTVIYAVGAGTPEGGTIPIGGGMVKRDSEAKIVKTKLNSQLLAEIARAGQGAAFNVRQGDAAVEAIRKGVASLEKRTVSVRSFRAFEPGFQWWLAPALALLLAAYLMPDFKKRSL